MSGNSGREAWERKRDEKVPGKVASSFGFLLVAKRYVSTTRSLASTVGTYLAAKFCSLRANKVGMQLILVDYYFQGRILGRSSQLYCVNGFILDCLSSWVSTPIIKFNMEPPGIFSMCTWSVRHCTQNSRNRGAGIFLFSLRAGQCYSFHIYLLNNYHVQLLFYTGIQCARQMKFLPSWSLYSDILSQTEMYTVEINMTGLICCLNFPRKTEQNQFSCRLEPPEARCSHGKNILESLSSGSSCANLGLVGSHELCLPTGGQTLVQA